MNKFKRLYNYIKTRKLHRQTVKQLNTLTDKQLSDIGLLRSQLDKMIWLKEDKEYSGKNN